MSQALAPTSRGMHPALLREALQGLAQQLRADERKWMRLTAMPRLPWGAVAEIERHLEVRLLELAIPALRHQIDVLLDSIHLTELDYGLTPKPKAELWPALCFEARH